MWNSNSRRWLVKDKGITRTKPTTTANIDTNLNYPSATTALGYKLRLHNKWQQCCNAVVVAATTTATNLNKLKHITSTTLSTTGPAAKQTMASMLTTTHMTTTLTSRRHKHKISRTATKTRAQTLLLLPTRVNPCLNQIIEVLLAILLVNCLLRHAMAQMPQALTAFGATTINEDDPLLASIFSSGSSANSYRHPYSIGDVGSGSGNTAFAYNALQQQHQEQQHEVQPNIDDFQSANQLPRSQNFKISPKPCSIGRIEGTCMFVWECIKSEGRHVGMCVDSFMFGSCCVHNYTDNIVMPQAFSYTRPTKPMGISSINHRPRPPHLQYKPFVSGMTTIERPHGAGTLVIRPSGPHHQGPLHKPYHTKPSTSSTTTSTSSTENSNSLWTSNAVLSDLQSAASISAPSSSSLNAVWHSSPSHHTASSSTSSSAIHLQQQQQHWHMTTEPNFITKPRPPIWGEKPTVLLRPKPSKPTKKPERPALHQTQIQQQQQHHHQQQQPQLHRPQTPPSAIVFSTQKPTSTPTRPKPQPPHYTKPGKPTTTQRPYTLPAQQHYTWAATSESVPNSSSSSNNFDSSTPSIMAVSSSTTGKTTTTTTTSTTQTSTTIQKYKPTTAATTITSSSSQSSLGTSKVTTHKPVTTPTQQRPTITTTTTLRPSSLTSISTAVISQTLLPQNLTTIESNEILDAASNGVGDDDDDVATIKTISAARSECGIPVLARPETRIVGGKSAPFGRWPWQVSVRRTSFFGFSSTHRCGGALINENWITTAGHCVDDLLISQIRIRVGEYDFSHVQEQLPYIERGVSKKVVHPKYNFFTYEYDLALVKLEQPLEFAPHVSPICLPQTESLLIGMNATVTGWGRLSEGGKLPSVLQEVSVPIVSNDNCKTMFLRAGRQEFIPDIFLCAGYETGGQDSCQGDSGGPLQVKSKDGHFFLAGIISWGIGCAEANLPGVCTRISKFVPWILENVT